MLVVSKCNLKSNISLLSISCDRFERKQEGNYFNKDPVGTIKNTHYQAPLENIYNPKVLPDNSFILSNTPSLPAARENKDINEENPNSLTENPSNKFKNMYSLAINYLKSRDYDNAVNILDTLLDYSVKNNLKKTEFKVLELLARAYDKTKKLNKSLDCYLKIFNQLKDDLQVNKKAEIANNIASLYADMQNYNLSISWYKKAFNYAFKVNDNEAMDIILDDMAIAKKHQLIFEQLV